MGNIVEKCAGCRKIDANENCMIYANPEGRHRVCECPGKTVHVVKKERESVVRSLRLTPPTGKFSGSQSAWWRRKKGLKGTRGVSTPGRGKGDNCKADRFAKYMAKSSRSYKDPNYKAWCESKKG